MTQPYGAERERNAAYKKWLSERGLKYVSRAPHCLHWISKGRCAVRICDAGHASRMWMDHISCYTKEDGTRMLLCQPYGMHGLRDVESLAEACREFGLKAEIHGDGWYGYGTIAIELTPRVEND